MQMREELRQRLAKEYRYVATKMQESTQPAKKLYYFSVLYLEAQRVFNEEWDRDLALIYVASQYAFNFVNALTQAPAHGVFPIDNTIVFTALTQATSDLATYLEKTEDSTEELHQIVGRFAEIGYAASGNGSYLYEKGLVKL